VKYDFERNLYERLDAILAARDRDDIPFLVAAVKHFRVAAAEARDDQVATKERCVAVAENVVSRHPLSDDPNVQLLRKAVVAAIRALD
jgi:hypothetical protein